jgi:hypothetical protein
MDDLPFSLIANLAKTPAPDQQRTGDKVDFVSAMQTLGYSSVFDILRGSKKSFVREMRNLSDADAELAYDNARCYATQIVRLYRNELISSGRKPAQTARTGVRSLVDVGPSFPNLFQENWDQFCKVGAIESKDSPVAYLTSLYRFAKRELEGTTDDTLRIKLETRRPDLASLVIDQQSTFKPVPMLEIVKTVLEKGIRTYSDTLEDGHPAKEKTIYQLIAERKHPFLFPYNYQHKQIQLGLSGKKPMLGEINYRISLKLPVYQTPSNDYGRVKTSSMVAQLLMSNLSPEQQRIVTEVSVFSEADQNNAYNTFYHDYYNSFYIAESENPLVTLNTFWQKTGINAEQTEELTATRQYLPVKSPNTGAPYPSIPRTFGAQYINKENANESYSIGIADSKLTQTTDKSFDRIQRMIRLQRWTGLPFAELDSLIAASALAEVNGNGLSTNPLLILNINTLRAIGTYRYIAKHYSLAVDDYSAIVHRISTYGAGEKTPQFDRIFNSPQLFDNPFIVGTTHIYGSPNDEMQQRASAQLCAALHVEQSADSLGVLINDIYYWCKPVNEEGARPTVAPTTALWSVSAFYRQARIAQLFKLSVKESRDLIDLLGGGLYLHAVVSGRLTSVPGTDSDPDLLDVLLQMDWAVNWLRELDLNVTTLRTQLGIGVVETTVSQGLPEALHQLAIDTHDTLLTSEKLAELGLPSTNIGNTSIDWWPLLKDIIDEHGLVIALPLTLEENSRAALREKVSFALDAVELGEGEGTITDQLTDFVLGGLLGQQRLIEGLLQKLSGLPMNRALVVVRWAGTDVARLLAGTLVPYPPDLNDLAFHPYEAMKSIFDAFRTVIRYSDVCQQLNLSAPALRAFLVNPGWLDPAFTESLLPLNLASFYHLDRYSRWVADSGAPEEQLVQYFIAANASAADKDLCAATLAGLIDWPATEILVATASLPAPIAKSMSEVDWLRRVKATSEHSALGTRNLLKAAALDPANVVALDWQTVGEAVVAPPRDS